MRTILALLTLFSCCTLAAQPYAPTENRERPRGTTIPCATAQEAAAAADTHRYGAPVTGWAFADGRYTASFTVPFAWSNRQVMLTVESVPADYELYVNGRLVGRSADGNTPADFNVTRHAREGRNEVEIRPSAPSQTAVLESWKRQTPAAALGAVRITSPATTGVRDVLVQTQYVGSERNEAEGEIGIVVKTYALNPRTVRIEYELLDPAGTTVASAHGDLTLGMRGEDTLRLRSRVPDSLLWSPERPQRYTLLLRTKHEGRFVEHLRLPVGFRIVGNEQGTLHLNGRPIDLRAREAAPTIGAEELQRLREAGCNTLRLTPGVVPPRLFELCDSLGICVIAQAPIDTGDSGTSRRVGGNPSNDPAWREAYIERVDNLYHTVKRHPSVIAFSIAAPSANGICLYDAYMRLKSYDDPRPVCYPGAAGEWNDDRLQTR